MHGLNGTVMGSQNPSLDQRCHPVNASHGDMGWLLRAQHDRALVVVAQVFERAVCGGPISAQDATGFDAGLDKGHNAVCRIIQDALKTDATKAFGLDHFHGNGDQYLVSIALSLLR